MCNMRQKAENALDEQPQPAYLAGCMETIRIPKSTAFMNPALEVDVPKNCASRNDNILDLVNDPFFLGKVSALDSGLIVQLKELEILIGQRRAQLEQVLGLDSHSLQQSLYVSPLRTGLVNCGSGAPAEIVEQERSVGAT